MSSAQRNALGLLAIGALLALAWWWDRRPLPPPPAEQAPATAATPASTGQPTAELQRDAGGCWVPSRFVVAGDSVERPRTQHWQQAAAAARWSEDACGNLWGLWFNSWVVFPGGQVSQVGHLQLSEAGPLAPLNRMGVAATVGLRGALWVLGRQGHVLRHDDAGWQALPMLERCVDGDMLMFDGEIWVACGAAAAQALVRWDAERAAWVSMRGELRGPERLAISAEGRLYAAGGGELARFEGGPERVWLTLAAVDARVTDLAADAGHIAVATEQGLWLFDAQGQPLRQDFPQRKVTGVAIAEHGLWAALWSDGLHHFDGARWHAWRYAQGLPSDEARDVAIDGHGQLWLAGSPSALIDAQAAAVQIGQLRAPPSLAGEVYADACAAAAARLPQRTVAGEVAQASIDGRPRVFFQGRQVCPDPWRGGHAEPLLWRRESDGALLELNSNGRRGHSDCGQTACVDSQLPEVRRWWRIRLHLPQPGSAGSAFRVRELPPPEPLPSQSPAAVAAYTAAGEVWVATRDDGIYRHDGARWWHYAADAGFVPGNVPQDLVADAVGAVWIASYAQWNRLTGKYTGLPLQRWSNGRWQSWSAETALPSWSSEALVAVPGGVLVGGNGGLARVLDNQVERLNLPPGRGFVAALSHDERGRVWVGHGHFDPGISLVEQGRAGYLSSRDGLFADRILALAHDDSQNLWLLADDGRVAVYPAALLSEHMRW